MTKKDLYLYNVFEDEKIFMYNAIGFDVDSAMEEFNSRIKPENIKRYSVVQYRKLTAGEIIEYAKISKWVADYINSK
jgi:hypothetical protein